MLALCSGPVSHTFMEIPIEYDPDFGKITDESELSDSWKELARLNVNDVTELRPERIA